MTDIPATTEEGGSAARRVAANAVNPFLAQIVTRVLMLGYGIVQYRVLGGGLLGDYFIAALVLLYTGTISDWGLSTLLTRDVAKERGNEREEGLLARLFYSTLMLRVLISAALFVPAGLFIAVYGSLFNLSGAGAWAILILTLSLLPGAFSGSVTALLYAYERMSLPAAIGIGTSALNVALGVGALLLGWGIVGLAAAATMTTFLTAAIFRRILRRDFPALRLRAGALRLERGEAEWLLRAGWPLMLNALLVGLFFRADQFVIKASAGAAGTGAGASEAERARASTLEVERYQAAYSFLNFVLLITPAVTLALFPRMARQAASDRPRLASEYAFALKVLLIISVPIVALTVWFAPLLVSVLTGGKDEYLPESAMVLQVLIFFLPFSFVNGVTQYVLIALDLQRLITRAFAWTVVFNLAANLLLVPTMGIKGAAVATILSELVLLGPFLVWTGREIGRVPLGALALKPFAAGLVVAGTAWALQPAAQRWNAGGAELAGYLGCGLLLLGVYGAALLVLRPFSEGEWGALRGALRGG